MPEFKTYEPLLPVTEDRARMDALIEAHDAPIRAELADQFDRADLLEQATRGVQWIRDHYRGGSFHCPHQS